MSPFTQPRLTRALSVSALALSFVWTTDYVSTARVQNAPSMWSGIYTEAQAARGEPLYIQTCAECHGSSLEGGEMAPSLADETFLYNWHGLTVFDLFERIRISMPQGKPFSVSRTDKADILAYMLARAGYPSGDTELGNQADRLSSIAFEAVRP
jgi:cytochrome c